MTSGSSIVGVWLHSYEEDTPEANVYRPVGFEFPPSRGRPGMEFRSDGTYLEIGPGADDRGSVAIGRWRDMGPGMIEISSLAGDRPSSVRRILHADHELLRIAKRTD